MRALVERLIAIALPCYIANASPVVAAKILRRTHPLDGGARFFDGRRVLGDSKSVEGFVVGVAAGTLTGVGLSLGGLLTPGEGFVLSLGAMVGDALGSFVKRRMGLEPGAPAPLLDQLSFLAVALALYSLTFGPIEAPVVAALLIITPPLHLLTNIAAYKLGLKSRPW